MKPDLLARMSVAELVDRFAALAVEQDQALLREDVAKINQIFDKLEDVEAELKRRDGDQRRALLGLYDHPNMQVQVKAAKATLAVAPQAARGALEAIREAKWAPQSVEAGTSLRYLDNGIYKPT
jgi:hypothetical protein